MIESVECPLSREPCENIPCVADSIDLKDPNHRSNIMDTYSSDTGEILTGGTHCIEVRTMALNALIRDCKDKKGSEGLLFEAANARHYLNKDI